MATYFLGCFWFRFSDEWQLMLIDTEPEERHWVVHF